MDTPTTALDQQYLLLQVANTKAPLYARYVDVTCGPYAKEKNAESPNPYGRPQSNNVPDFGKRPRCRTSITLTVD